MPMLLLSLTLIASAVAGTFFPPPDGRIHNYPVTQVVMDLANGRCAVAGNVHARALGQAHLDTVVVTDAAGRERSWAMARYLPAGVVVEEMELSPCGRDLLITAYGRFDDNPSRRQLMIAAVPADDGPLVFREAVPPDRWRSFQADADIDPDGNIYFVSGQVMNGLGGGGHLARTAGTGVQALTDRGWIDLPRCYRSNMEDDLLIDGVSVGRRVSGRKPTVAYDADGNPAGLFFEAPGDIGTDFDGLREPLPAVYHADPRGLIRRVTVIGHADVGQPAHAAIDEFLHRAFDGSRPVAAFLHKGPMVDVPGGMEGSGDLVRVVPDAAAPDGFRLRLEWVKTSAVAFPTRANPEAH